MMEVKTNYHTHSTWCDGRCTVEGMADGAEEKGFAALGFSSHAMLPADPLDWPLTAPRLAAYAECVRAEARRREGRLRILCGVEADYVKGACFPDRPVYAAISPDYVIGSVHFVVAPDGEWIAVDNTPEELAKGISDHFGGSAEAFVRAYFAQQREMASLYDFDVIGHPDLCRKFNGRLGYFDEGSPWYREELAETAEAFAASGKLVEVNTGAISRGWMDDAYPSAAFRDELRSRGVRFVLSSDAHSADALDCAFDRFGSCEDFVASPA